MTSEGMELLADLVRLRREHMGLKQGDLVAYGGPGVSTVGKIERGAQDHYAARTLQQMDKALGWKLGTCAEIIRTPDREWWPKGRSEFEDELVEADLPDVTPTKSEEPAPRRPGILDAVTVSIARDAEGLSEMSVEGNAGRAKATLVYEPGTPTQTVRTSDLVAAFEETLRALRDATYETANEADLWHDEDGDSVDRYTTSTSTHASILDFPQRGNWDEQQRAAAQDDVPKDDV